MHERSREQLLCLKPIKRGLNRGSEWVEQLDREVAHERLKSGEQVNRKRCGGSSTHKVESLQIGAVRSQRSVA